MNPQPSYEEKSEDLPYNIERLEQEVSLVKVEVNDKGQLLINGVVQEKYDSVNDLHEQNNNQNFISFNSSIGEKNNRQRILR